MSVARFSGSATCLPRPRVVAIGNFDGVHLGHQAVLGVAAEHARRHQIPLTVYTFDPAPTAILAPERHQARITTLEDRVRLLGEVGVDEVVVEAFDTAFAGQSAEWFARGLLQERLCARTLVVGHDFRFGHQRRGDAEKLRAWRPDLDVVQVDAFEMDGVISSSRIRKLIAAGSVEQANRLLGRPHFLSGVVVQGDQRGRTIGFPTANLQNEVELLPTHGVYASRVTVAGVRHRAVTNIGLRPTFSGTRFSVESHLLDFEGDLYGQSLRVELHAFLRPEQRFSGIEALVAQIRLDVAAARGSLA